MFYFCLRTPSHCLNHYWLYIRKVLQDSPESNLQKVTKLLLFPYLLAYFPRIIELKLTVTRGTQSYYDIFRYVLMMRCWVVRPRDRPSFKDVVIYIKDLLHPHGEDESDSYYAMDTQRHEGSAVATGDQDIESGIEDTSLSRPCKRFHQASTPNEYLAIIESPMFSDCDWFFKINQILITGK